MIFKDFISPVSVPSVFIIPSFFQQERLETNFYRCCNNSSGCNFWKSEMNQYKYEKNKEHFEIKNREKTRTRSLTRTALIFVKTKNDKQNALVYWVVCISCPPNLIIGSRFQSPALALNMYFTTFTLKFYFSVPVPNLLFPGFTTKFVFFSPWVVFYFYVSTMFLKVLDRS